MNKRVRYTKILLIFSFFFDVIFSSLWEKRIFNVFIDNNNNNDLRIFLLPKHFHNHRPNFFEGKNSFIQIGSIFF